MISYYARRAAEYERIYRKPERQGELRRIERNVSEAFPGLDVLEVACGTGYWTQFAARAARSILATDINDETLEIARRKDYGGCRVEFVNSDAYALDEAAGPFSGGLAAFWWSHIPKAALAQFLRVFHSKLEDGAPVLMLDNCYAEGSSTPVSRTDAEGNTYQMRVLADGSRHEVLKNFCTESEFAATIDGLGTDLEFTRLRYYWLASYRVSSGRDEA
jgi:demethylmenaquinone methyltransferase/2-methoxy-6-polyprenyl-1,4-benzoquinol methylase